jgi:hypothetical protein
MHRVVNVNNSPQKKMRNFAPSYMDKEILKAWLIDVFTELRGRRNLKDPEIGLATGQSKQTIGKARTKYRASEDVIKAIRNAYGFPGPGEPWPQSKGQTGEVRYAELEKLLVDRVTFERIMHINDQLISESKDFVQIIKHLTVEKDRGAGSP